MTTEKSKRSSPSYRRLPSGPIAVALGTSRELALLEPVLRKAGLGMYAHEIDPVSLDVESIVMNESLMARIAGSILAIVVADVSGDDRLPIISFIDEALLPDRPLLVSCAQAGATEQAAMCLHSDRVVGFSPWGLLSEKQVVELAPALGAESDFVDQCSRVLASGGLTVHVVMDTPGLVSGRLLLPVVNDAVFALSEGIASAEDIDTAIQLGANFPFGPLSWADAVGVDRVLLGLEYLLQATHEERYRPAPLLRRMAQAGRVGRDAGRGFFDYPDDENE